MNFQFSIICSFSCRLVIFAACGIELSWSICQSINSVDIYLILFWHCLCVGICSTARAILKILKKEGQSSYSNSHTAACGTKFISLFVTLSFLLNSKVTRHFRYGLATQAMRPCAIANDEIVLSVCSAGNK